MEMADTPPTNGNTATPEPATTTDPRPAAPLATAQGSIRKDEPSSSAGTQSTPTSYKQTEKGKWIGRGSSGDVYRGSCNGEHVAVKVRP